MNEDPRRPIEKYLAEYRRFAEVCSEDEQLKDLSSMEIAILHHGYATGGK